MRVVAIVVVCLAVCGGVGCGGNSLHLYSHCSTDSDCTSDLFCVGTGEAYCTSGCDVPGATALANIGTCYPANVCEDDDNGRYGCCLLRRPGHGHCVP